MRIGLACPYTWNVPGGVQAHTRDLAETLLRLGHDVSVLTPADEDAELPPYAVPAGRAVPIPYNGSVARLQFGPVAIYRVRRWLREGRFDVLHAQEPVAPSVSLLACLFATGPIVATFHTSNTRARLLAAAQPLLAPALEKMLAKIAVSDAARRTVVEHLGGDPYVIPNGVHVAAYRGAELLPGHPDGRTIAFVGRIDEPRKGLPTLLEALPGVLAARPDARLLVAGPGDIDEIRGGLPPEVRDAVTFLGLVSEEHKRRLFRSADVYVAPNTGGESFGIVLTEAMAAGTAVVASDFEAFRSVLDDGGAGVLVPVGDASALAAAVTGLLDDPALRGRFVARADEVVAAYDWDVVARAVVRVYETVARGAAVVGEDPASLG